MKRGRGPIVVLLIISLLATAGIQHAVRQQREILVPRPRSASRLSNFDTFALGLVLGGLRGPLVMFLWTSSETRKADRNLEDVDTQIELIRMLQPEFDSVHIFQIWNKAYNLSVQMASLPNKYATILGALDYARQVDEERPDNINILASIADLYFQKLGNSAERKYYIGRVRRETRVSSTAAPTGKQSQSWQPLQHRAFLDANGMIQSGFLAPRLQSGKPGDAAGDRYNGATLQYLARYSNAEAGGFPYGISPLALGYNYFRRASALMAATGQKHVQISDTVIDSRPAVALRGWAEEEMERALQRELEALGKPVPELKNDLQRAAAGEGQGAKFIENRDKASKLAAEAIFSFRRTMQAAHHAKEEYERHMVNQTITSNADVYLTHIDTVIALAAQAQADHDYLAVMAASAGLVPLPAGKDAASLRTSAAESYQKAINAYYILTLQYYTDMDITKKAMAQVIKPSDATKLDRSKLKEIDPKLLPEIHRTARAIIAKNEYYDASAEDVAEYEACIARAQQRLQQLGR